MQKSPLLQKPDRAAMKRRSEELKSFKTPVFLHKKKDEELIAKANDMLFHLDSAVRAFDAAVRATNEFKDNETMHKIRKQKEREDGEVDRAFDDLMEAKQRENFRQDQQKAQQKRLKNQYFSEIWKQEVKEKKRLKAAEERLVLEQEKETLRLAAEAQRQQKKGEEEKVRKYDRMARDFIVDKSVERALELQEQEIERKKVEETRRQLERHWDNMEKDKQKKTSERVKKLEDTSMKVAVILQKEVEDQNARRAEELVKTEASEKQKLQRDQQRLAKEKQYRAARIRSISAYRNSVLRAKAETLNAEEQEGKASLLEHINTHKLFLETEQHKKEIQRDQAQLYNDFNKKVIADKNATQEEVNQMEKEKLEMDQEFWANYDNRFQEYVAEKFKLAEEKQLDTTPMRFFLKKHQNNCGTAIGHGLWHGNVMKEINYKIPEYLRAQGRKDYEGLKERHINTPKRCVTWRSPEVSGYVSWSPSIEEVSLQSCTSTPTVVHGNITNMLQLPPDTSIPPPVCGRKGVPKSTGTNQNRRTQQVKGPNPNRRTPTYILPTITSAGMRNLSLPHWHP